MFYQIFHNQDSHFMRPAIDGDRYVTGWMGAINLPESNEVALEHVFWLHNHDERPDRLVRPSLSLGDVIVLAEPYKKWTSAWTVDVVGFLPIPIPQNISATYPEED